MKTNTDIIIERYCGTGALRDVVVRHSKQVADMAAEIVRQHPELNADEQFVREAAMLHDIGIVKCDAPNIHCHGSEPYIRHGLLGAEILRREGMERHARVAERHTGTGLTIENIRTQGLPLPLRDFSPETIEEQIICYADKFFSKTHLEQTKTVEQARLSISKFGSDSVERFNHWHKLFTLP